MGKRRTNASNVEHVLMNGQVTLIETAKKDILWRVAGSDFDGRRMEVVVAVDQDAVVIKVVTAF